MEGGSRTVLHVSDLQCGRPFVARAAEAMVRLAHEVAPDVVVCSGDLTQRAKAREFEQARALLDRLGGAPIVLTPGNHDVPLYRAWERIWAPHRNWMRFAGPELDTVTRVGEVTLVALDSSAPHRALVNGRIDPRQVAFAREAFRASGEGSFRVLVTHHHFVGVADGEGGAPLPDAAAHIRAFEAMGVDVVLGGHVHQLHFRTSADVPGVVDGRAMPIIASGTSASRRGRGPERGWNSLNVVRLAMDAVEVTPYRLGPDGSDFEAGEPVRFPRGTYARARAAATREATS